MWAALLAVAGSDHGIDNRVAGGIVASSRQAACGD